MAKRQKPILRFFRKNTMENPNETLDLNEIAETPAEEQVDVAPMHQDIEQSAPEAPTTEAKAGDCGDCNGTGLKDQSTICPSCGGTGKVA